MSRAEARGTVLEYRAQLFSNKNPSANEPTIYSNASEVYIPLSLETFVQYAVSISARTRAGYNESLEERNISILTEPIGKW